MSIDKILFAAFLDAAEHKVKEDKKNKNKKPKKKKELGFSTDIDKVQGFCFEQGINGDCNEQCEHYMKECCELLLEKEQEGEEMKFELIETTNKINELEWEVQLRKKAYEETPEYKAYVAAQNAHKMALEIHEAKEQDLINAMLEKGVSEFTQNGYKIKLRNMAKMKVVLEDIGKVPAEFKKVSYELDKKNALSYIKETGEIPPGLDIDDTPKYKIDVKSVKK